MFRGVSMKKSVVKAQSPSHLHLLWSWVIYFALYFLTEKLIPWESCHVIHSVLDDHIPFCEVFVIPYVFWYGLILFSLLYFLRHNADSFKKLQIYIIITQIAAMTIYILFPNRQDLRPVDFPRENVFTAIISWLYAIDTSTNVCPSLHVAYSIAMASVWVKEKAVRPQWKVFIVIAVVLICMSTVLIKQHSVLDGLAALPICLFAEILLYRDYYKEKWHP